MRRLFLSLSLCAAAGAVHAQGVAPSAPGAGLVGTWRADLPLPTGVVQTFRFEPGGQFHLLQSVSMAGTYRLDGSRLVQTVTLPSGTVTDTVTARLAGDALTFSAAADGGSKTLHRDGPATPGGAPLIGRWSIVLGGGLSATYTFAPDGTFRTDAVMGDEEGRYVVRGTTLELTSDRTFQLPASSRFQVQGDVLVLTPPRGTAGARRFHRIAAP